MSTKITREYANPSSGGRERVRRKGDDYYISSNIPQWGAWFTPWRRVSKADCAYGLKYTCAPADVVDQILN